MTQINVAIIGASGYTGAELVRILHLHPHVKIAALAADKSAGQPISAIYPHLAGFGLPDVVTADQIDWKNIEVVFCCLPHAASQAVIKELPNHLKVIDLSADFRLYDTATYAKWYDHEHLAPELQKEAVYGLSEVYRDKIAKARLIACPGCYPTCSTLPLVPLVKDKLISVSDIIIDAKSGISGAGRSAKQANLFCEMNEAVRAYSVCNHRHIPEIEQTLSDAAKQAVTVQFTPQVVPMSRGMLATVYVKLEAGNTLAQLRASLESFYKGSAFVHVLPEGQSPSTRDVAGTNKCHIALFAGRTPDRAVIVSAIDNLAKGAAGQAVQNLNILYQWDEKLGLDTVPVFP